MWNDCKITDPWRIFKISFFSEWLKWNSKNHGESVQQSVSYSISKTFLGQNGWFFFGFVLDIGAVLVGIYWTDIVPWFSSIDTNFVTWVCLNTIRVVIFLTFLLVLWPVFFNNFTLYMIGNVWSESELYVKSIDTRAI